MRLLACLLLILISASAGFSKEKKYPVDEIPIEVRLQENTVVREDKTVVDLNKSSAIVEHKQAVTLLNDADFDYFSDWRVYYDYEENVSSISLKIYDADGNEIANIKQKEIEDIALSSGMASDNRLKIVEIDEYAYPFTVEFTYTKKVKNTYLLFPRWVPSEMPSSYVQQASLTINKPATIDFTIDYRLHGFELTQNIVTPERIYFFAKEIPSFSPEDYGPTKWYQRPHIILSPHQFEIDGYVGSFENWSTLGDFYYRLNEDRYEIEEEFVQPIKEKVEKAATVREKVEAIYQYLQEKTRYVSVQLGIGGWQSFSAEYVEENSFGDCKALTTYTKSLLSYFDIESYPVLIKSGSDNDRSFQLDEKTAYSAFDHVILTVPNEKDTIWLECTSQSNPTGYLGTFTMDRKGVIVKPNGESRLVNTPQTNLETDQSTKVIDITLTEDGNAEVEIHLTAKGVLAEYYADANRSLSEEDFRKELADIVDIPNSRLKEYTFTKKPNAMEVDLTAAFSTKNIANKTGSRLFLSPLQFQIKRGVISDVEDRKHPIILPFAFKKTLTINYHIPEGYVFENIESDPLEISSKMGLYKLNTTMEENTLTVDTTYESNPGVYPADSAAEFQDFTTEINKAAKRMAVLKKQ